MFSNEQRALLLDLIEQRKNIIEAKENTTSVNLKKVNTWKEIAQIFNNTYPTENKTILQIKDVYKRLKIKAKKTATIRKRNLNATGGGPPINLPLTSIDEQLQRIDSSLIDEIVNPYDDDATIEKENSPSMEEARSAVSQASGVVPALPPTPEFNVSETPKLSSTKHRTSGVARIENMARLEHEAKMRIYALKEQILTIKLEKLKGKYF